MNPIPDHPSTESRNAQAAACSYLLVMVLQRLDKQQDGLIKELVAGVEADRRAIPAHAPDKEFIEQVFAETLKILSHTQQL